MIDWALKTNYLPTYLPPSNLASSTRLSLPIVPLSDFCCFRDATAQGARYQSETPQNQQKINSPEGVWGWYWVTWSRSWVTWSRSWVTMPCSCCNHGLILSLPFLFVLIASCSAQQPATRSESRSRHAAAFGDMVSSLVLLIMFPCLRLIPGSLYIGQCSQ